jgi:O-antigen/teichoic acid export membrane protein
VFSTGMASMLAEMGLGRAIVQFRDLDRRELDACFWITMTLAIIAYAVLALGASIIARWFAVPRVAEVLPVLALVLPLTACSVVSDSLLRKQLALHRISQAEIIGGVVALPVMLGCALSGLGVWALVAGSLVQPGARSIATFAFAPWRPGLRIGGERAKEVLDFSINDTWRRSTVGPEGARRCAGHRQDYCVHQIEMSLFLPFRNVTSVGSGGGRARSPGVAQHRIGAKPLPGLGPLGA